MYICLWCAVLLCLVVFDLACFFLPSFSSLIPITCICTCPNTCIHVYRETRNETVPAHPVWRLGGYRVQ